MNHLSDEQINEYVDQLLSSAEAETVERHLRGCTLCQQKVEEIQQVFSALTELEEVPLQRDLAASVLGRIELPPSAAPECRPARKLPGWAPGLAWTIAALQIPLASLAFVYTWPRLRTWLAPIEGLIRQPGEGFASLHGLSAWWNGWLTNAMVFWTLAWSSLVQRMVENLSTQSHLPNVSPQAGLLILAALLAAWAAGNYWLFNADGKTTA